MSRAPDTLLVPGEATARAIGRTLRVPPCHACTTELHGATAALPLLFYEGAQHTRIALLMKQIDALPLLQAVR